LKEENCSKEHFRFEILSKEERKELLGNNIEELNFYGTYPDFNESPMQGQQRFESM
jgi:lipid II:glycine glycyltransferase (peptidoglycan interpeptide bridge formation enzyme)